MLVTRPPGDDYTNDINLARSAGIDAFAINFGGWNVNFTQQEGYLKDFYTAAETQNCKVFISIDCTSVTDSNMVVRLTNQYANSPAQFKIDGNIYFSSNLILSKSSLRTIGVRVVILVLLTLLDSRQRHTGIHLITTPF
jgi:hypothetical protein